MKSLSKRVTALMLAAITAIPGLFGAPFLSSAETATDLKTFNVEFIRANGESVELTVAQGEALGELPSNSPATHIDSTNTHNAFTWNGVDAQTVVTSDLTVTETSAIENCSFSAGEHTDATEQLNGYTTYSCVCGNSYNEYDAQEWKWYDAALDYYDEIISASDYQTKYTASSQTAYSNAVEDARLDESNETIPQTAIDNSTDAISNAKNLLEEAADFTALRDAYSKANDFLLGLNDGAAQYESASIQALIDAVSQSDVATYLGATDISVFDEEDQDAADALADAINHAYDGINSYNPEVDYDVYTEAVNVLNNIDADAYDVTSPSLGSAKRVANNVLGALEINYADPLDSSKTSTINALKVNAEQKTVDSAVTIVLNTLGYCVKKYTVITEGAETDVSFQSGTTTGLTSPYTATYGSKAIARSENSETAWYTEFTSGSTHRPKQFQGVGDTFSTRVFGDLVITAETRTSAAPNMIRIYRNYSNDPEKTPLEAVAFANQSYVLPQAKAYPGYSFAGYDIGGEIKSAGEAIEITDDLDIDALYTFNESAHYAVNATARENGKGFNDTVAYNTTISLEGGDDAYAWVEEVSTGSYRPFAIGSDISFFVCEATTLFSVTQEEFNAFKFTLPTINMRKSGTIVSGTKVTFNGQIVDAEGKIKEYGVVVGVAKDGGSVNADDVDITNVGSHEGYDVIRAKSTQSVGANQFSIGINGLAGKDYIYKGYVIYEEKEYEFLTIYTDIM